ncbi:MAG: hypothetical protein CVT79_17600 [Alphaproteobacteria bacterium HGW-Alphaproteobacteria-18]|nr:MAG: hypothetical protein CVT79_17600 [Alphaproteobacteria bacterium HGW-Alphaproteobacteria-18]
MLLANPNQFSKIIAGAIALALLACVTWFLVSFAALGAGFAFLSAIGFVIAFFSNALRRWSFMSLSAAVLALIPAANAAIIMLRPMSPDSSGQVWHPDRGMVEVTAPSAGEVWTSCGFLGVALFAAILVSLVLWKRIAMNPQKGSGIV